MLADGRYVNRGAPICFSFWWLLEIKATSNFRGSSEQFAFDCNQEDRAMAILLLFQKYCVTMRIMSTNVGRTSQRSSQ